MSRHSIDSNEFLPNHQSFNGIRVSYNKSRRTIELFAWHGNSGLHDPVEIDLGTFARRLGISAKDIAKSLDYPSRQPRNGNREE